MKKSKFFRAALSMLLAAALLFCLCSCAGQGDESGQTSAESQSQTQGAQSQYQQGYPELTDFTAATAQGGSFTEKQLESYDLTVINFWATYCGPCVREMPELAELEAGLPDNVQLITVCLDAESESEAMEQILSSSGYEGITLTSFDGSLMDFAYKIRYIPTTVFVDSSGKMAAEPIEGGVENLAEAYTQAINSALEQMGAQQVQL